MRIPERGVPRAEVLAQLERFREHDMPWRDGRTWAYVYDPGRERLLVEYLNGLFVQPERRRSP